MDQNNPNQTKMDKNGPFGQKWTKIVQNCSKLEQNGPKSTKMNQIRPKSTKMVRNGPKWHKMNQIKPHWDKLYHIKIAKWFRCQNILLSRTIRLN